MEVKFNWDALPSTKLEASRLLTPLGCLIRKNSAKVPTLTSFPTKCSNCGAFTSIYTKYDTTSDTIFCPFCQSNSKLETGTYPQEIDFQSIGESDDTFDYVLPTDIAQPIVSRGPVVLFVVDTYQHVECPKEMAALKKRLIECILEIPPETPVGLITFNRDVTLHLKISDIDISVDDFPLTSDLNDILGNKPMLAHILLKIANNSKNNIWKGQNLLQSGYFFSPSDLIQRVNELTSMPTRSFKSERASGLALLVASLLLLSASSSSLLGKVMFFSSGPCTIGPGLVVKSAENIRTHDDIANMKARHFADSSKFYRALSYVACGYTLSQANDAAFSLNVSLTDFAVKPSAPKFSINLFFGALDQVGLYEMSPMSSGTGGSIIFSDSFESHSFGNKLMAITPTLSDQDNCITVMTSTGLKVSYSLNYGTPYQSSYQYGNASNFHHQRISDTITGFESLLRKRYFTNRWYLGDLRDSVSCVLFEVDPLALNGKDVYIQFQLEWWSHELQKRVIRSSTLRKQTTLSTFLGKVGECSKITKKVSESARHKALLSSFNPDTWITILTRLLINKIDTTLGFESFEEVIDIMDSTLIRITNLFGNIKKEASVSENPFEKLKTLYLIDEHFKSLPIYGYYLRRNPQLVSIFNSSPDETAFFHHIFMGLGVEESCIFIQPKLYEVCGRALSPRPLLTTSIQSKDDGIFYVLDTYHTIIIYLHCNKNKLRLHSSDNDDIIYGRKLEKINRILDIVESELTTSRTFVPKLVLTQTGHSQARFLLSRLLPPNNILVDGKKTKRRWWQREKLQKQITKEDISSEKYLEEVLTRAHSFKIQDDF